MSGCFRIRQINVRFPGICARSGLLYLSGLWPDVSENAYAAYRTSINHAILEKNRLFSQNIRNSLIKYGQIEYIVGGRKDPSYGKYKDNLQP